MKRFPGLPQLFLWFFILFFIANSTSFADNDLRRKIAQMLMVGFSGTTVPDTLQADLQKRNLGGVILFGHNLQNPAQIRSLTTALSQQARVPLFISIDQEGGRVARLRESNGFASTYSAYQLGTIFNSEDSTRKAAAMMAFWLAQSGVNMNLAPVVDVNVNPNSPAIGRLDRSFSADPLGVSSHAGWYIEELHRQKVITAL